MTAYVVCFIKKCKKQPGACESNVTHSEMNNTELVWIRAIQRYSFACEIQYLKSPTFPCPVLVNQFGLFLDDQQVLRCKGRLSNSSLCLQSRNPVILPYHHRTVELLDLWAHQKVKQWCFRHSDIFTRKLLDFEGAASSEKDYKVLLSAVD